MGSVTLRRVNQIPRSLAQQGLVRSDEPLHMLTNEGLTYLARRDRAAVGLTLDRWSAEPLYLNADIYAGTAVRSLASQLRHHAGVIDFASALSAEVVRSPDHDLFDLLPTSRSSIGYRYDWTTYVIHPDASFTLEYRGRWRPYLLEFERRATTPKRARARLKSYQRHFDSRWAERGRPPSLDLDTALQGVVDSARALTALDYAAITVFGGPGQKGMVNGITILPDSALSVSGGSGSRSRPAQTSRTQLDMTMAEGKIRKGNRGNRPRSPPASLVIPRRMVLATTSRQRPNCKKI